jgi:predicted glycoside hydrolase/deacetylase ChbG (UPF0249 family)
VNAGIIRSHVDGIVTSASLMPTGLAFDEAVELAHATPSLDIGVHLTLVGERPVLPPAAIPSLVDPTGRLLPSVRAFTRRYLLGRISAVEVTRELEAQVGRVRSAGLRPTHLDSHQHVHMLPRVLHAVLRVARHFGVPWIRLPAARLSLGAARAGGPARALEAVALRGFCLPARRRLSACADGMVGFMEGGRLDRAALRRIVNELPPRGLWELVCHPGLADAASPYAWWGYRWADELEALTDPEVASAIRARGIRLASFREPTPDIVAASALGVHPRLP